MKQREQGLNVDQYIICSLPVEQQKSTLEVPFQYFKNVNLLNADQRRAAFDRVLLMLLKSSKTQAFIEFFVGHLPEVLSILEEKYVKVCVHGLLQITFPSLSIIESLLSFNS